jgi:cytochrome c556
VKFDLGKMQSEIDKIN